MTCFSSSKAIGRYNRRMLVVAIIYIVVLLSVVFALKHLHLARPIVIVLSILPSIPIIGMVSVVGLYLREETDEFLRHLLIQSLLWTMGVTLAATSVWGFLELFAAAPRISQFYVFVAYWIFYGIVNPIVRQRYRAGATDE
jgi:hypothetical protein